MPITTIRLALVSVVRQDRPHSGEGWQLRKRFMDSARIASFVLARDSELRFHVFHGRAERLRLAAVVYSQKNLAEDALGPATMLKSNECAEFSDLAAT